MSAMYDVGITLTSSGPDTGAHFELVVDAYARLEAADARLLDVGFGYTRRDSFSVIEVEITVAADSDVEAWEIARSSLRAAIHEVGGNTPDWDDLPLPDALVYRLANQSLGLVGA